MIGNSRQLDTHPGRVVDNVIPAMNSYSVALKRKEGREFVKEVRELLGRLTD
jgi:hypothetical protein